MIKIGIYDRSQNFHNSNEIYFILDLTKKGLLCIFISQASIHRHYMDIKNQSKVFRNFCNVRKFCKERAPRGLVVKIDLDKSEVGFSRIFKMSQPI